TTDHLVTASKRMLEVLDVFAAEGLPIKVTELDITTQDRSLQADFFRDVLITAYSYPGVEGVLLWGFWADRHWRPDAALFASDWTPTPQVAIWDDYVLGAWRETAPATTNNQGAAEIRCHHGTYRVTATIDGHTSEATVEVSPGGATTEIRIETRTKP
ncbi:MAG: endo-1,4-beta-xylanase, partial [Planctomycetota bacterium]